jgi:lipoprotein-anchoring transpeptidase ErfK/SrfK
MRDIRRAPLTRRRLLTVASLAIAASALGVRTAAAADSWLQNFAETDLWNRARNGRAVDRAPQWSYFKQLGPQQGSRVPVEHPLTKERVFVDADVVGPAGAPAATYVYKSAQPAAPVAAPAAPATTPPPAGAPAVLPPVPAQGVTPGSWVASIAPTQLWTAPEGGIMLGGVVPGLFFKVLEAAKAGRLKVQDPFTSGVAYVDAKTLGAVGQPAALRVPDRWWGSVGGDNINVRSAPTGDGALLGTLPQGTPVSVEAWVAGQEVLNDQPGWAQLAEGVYVYGPLLRKAYIETPPSMPSHGALGSRWIDTNLTHQTVTAYEHDRPIYMTSTSSGRPGWETHEGIHEILWRKENETMDSESLVGRDAARASYRIENIRWTQYFTSDGQAIHENFWRDPALFGIPSSHGCLGMGAQDALWFWLWAGPGVPISVHY